jgi:hypothetical protein
VTQAQAQILVAKLAAAFPRDWSYVGAATNAIYVDRIMALKIFEAADEAITNLIDHERKLPPIGLIREAYSRCVEKHLPRELEPPPPSEDERSRIARFLASYRIGRPMPGADE